MLNNFLYSLNATLPVFAVMVLGWILKKINFLSDEFMKYHTPDGGGYYTAMAANVSSIYAGHTIGATPDGR